jgi:SAM-dependent methyltransferase
VDGVAEHLPGARRLLDRSMGGDILVEMLVAQGFSTGGAAPFDIATAFDRFDRAADLPALVSAIARDLRPGGLLFATAPCASGFEVQTLWERNETLLPPDKLNVPSVEGLRRLLSSPRWEILELSTPGLFDAENVRRAVAHDAASWPRAVRALVATDDGDGTALQELLQRTRRASFARVIARRAV